MTAPSARRCAIYTRKSTEEGLEQDFNSLDAQREACAAYILSQTHEGWQAIDELYDDGGYSGGTMERPAIQQLLADVRAGKVDIIVVYKVDRLTRSLADFAKMVELFDAHEVSFVSVTQSFNTTTSMGRLTLNVLLSFAQFEREVTGERIRDKIAASKKKGMWMGGPVPIGYDCRNRRLNINEAEAATVRMIFRRYLELRSIPRLVDDLAAKGARTKLRTYRDGSTVGGIPFQKGPLAALLKNRIYTGAVVHKGEVYPGQHDAIVDAGLFEQVQQQIAKNRHERALGRKARNPSLLTGMIVDPDGRPMTPVHSTRASKRYRYYVSRLSPGEDKAGGWRMPAGEIEALVIRTVADELTKAPGAADQDAAALAEMIRRDAELAAALPSLSISEQRAALMELGCSVKVADKSICLLLQRSGSETASSVDVEARLANRGSDLRLVLSPNEEQPERAPDPVLLKLIAKSHAVREMMLGGEDDPLVSGYGRRHMHQLMRISYLAPDIISAIVEGRQPADLTGRRLLRATDIPLDWAGQRQMLGFA